MDGNIFSTLQWTNMIIEKKAIPILRQHILAFLDPTHPPYCEYSSESQKNGHFSRPIHPVHLLT